MNHISENTAFPLISDSQLFSNKGSDYLMIAFALLLGCLFYSAGNFGFLNVFGVRREIQVLLLIMLTPSIPIVLARYSMWFRQPLWWLTIIMLLAEILIRKNQSVFFLVDRLTAVYIVALIFSFSHKFSDQLLKVIIVLSAVFSAMAIIQAIILMIDPQPLYSFGHGYVTSTQADLLELGHPLEHLGFTTGGGSSLLGVRFKSFTSEPSAIICAFVMPGVLALGYKGILRYTAIPIMIFSLLLARSGTANLSIILGGIAFMALLFFKTRKKLFIIVTFVSIFLWYFILSKMDVLKLMAVATDSTEDVGGDHFGSGIVRLSWMAHYFSNWKTYLFFGLNKDPGCGVGFQLHMFLYAGIVGVLIAIKVSKDIFEKAIDVFARNTSLERIMAAMFYGAFVQINMFSEFGWMSMPGMMLITIMFRRLQIMSGDVSKGYDAYE